MSMMFLAAVLAWLLGWTVFLGMAGLPRYAMRLRPLSLFDDERRKEGLQ